MSKIVDQVQGRFANGLVVDAGIRNIQIEPGSNQVDNPDYQDGNLWSGSDIGTNAWNIDGQKFRNHSGSDQNPPEQGAQNDGDNEQPGGQQLGEDAVFGR